jgi:hypothetical protein
MKIETTISCMINGVCLFETDVTAVIDYKYDRRHGELDWWVDEYLVEGEHRIWDKAGHSTGKQSVTIVVPEKLAEAFDEHLDRDWMEEQIRERLADYADDRADYLRDQMMDR